MAGDSQISKHSPSSVGSDRRHHQRSSSVTSPPTSSPQIGRFSDQSEQILESFEKPSSDLRALPIPSLSTPAKDIFLGVTDPNDPAMNVSAFEYAMREYDNLKTNREIQLDFPSPTETNIVSEIAPGSPLLTPPKIEPASVGNDHFGPDEPNIIRGEISTDDRIPLGLAISSLDQKFPLYNQNILNNKLSRHQITSSGGIFRSRMYLLHLRTLLMRCQVLHYTVLQVQRQAWDDKTSRPPRWYYSRIRSVAEQALKLGTALESNELQAQCEYWAGCGCGGTRDYKLAVDHFIRAIQFDTKAYGGKKDQPIPQGLRPDEKSNVEYLLQSVMARHADWQARRSHFLPGAEFEAERTGRSLEDCMEGANPGIESPAWMPDRDWVLTESKKNFEMRSGLDSEQIGKSDGQSKGLSEAEWRYIKYGDKMTSKHQIREGHKDPQTYYESQPNSMGMPTPVVVQDGKERSHQIPSPSLPSSTMSAGPYSDWDGENALDQELKESGWVDRSSSREVSQSPAQSSLGSRRNLSISPINTYVEVDLATAVSGPMSATDKDGQEVTHHGVTEGDDGTSTDEASAH